MGDAVKSEVGAVQRDTDAKVVEAVSELKQLREELGMSRKHVLEMLYLLYKGNFISRVNARELLGLMDMEKPKEGIEAYFKNEIAKI